MKRLLVISMFVMLLLAGCTEVSKSASFNSDEPPNAVGTADGKEILFVIGTYQWNNAIADAPSPDELVKDKTVYVAKPNSELSLEFEGEKPEKVSVGLWENKNFAPLPNEGGATIVPSEPGRYVLTVWGEWPDGDHASYSAAIEVKE